MDVQTITCLVLCACAAVACLAALRAWLLERRSGFLPSTRRLLTTASCAALAIATTAALEPAASHGVEIPHAARHESAQISALRARLKVLDAKSVQLDNERRRIRTQIGSVSASGGEVDLVEPVRKLRPLLATVFALGALAALLLGPSASLLPTWLRRLRRGGSDPTRSLATLEQVATLVAEDKYEEAQRIVEEIREADLEPIDQIDFWFLRAYCAVQCGVAEDAARDKEYQIAIAGLRAALALAPRAAHVRYLLAHTLTRHGDFQEGLAAYREVRGHLDGKLPFDENESFCLLSLGEVAYSRADANAANGYFEEVKRLQVLADQIPTVMLRCLLRRIRECVARRQLDEARTHLAAMRAVRIASEREQANVELICDVIAVVISQRSGDRGTRELVETFIQKSTPQGLPEPTDEAADEFLAPAVDPAKLPFPAALYRSVHFLLAVEMARRCATAGDDVTEQRARDLARPLLRSLQFEPRHPDSLAALGVLYFWFVPESRREGFAWLRSALQLGSTSKIAREVYHRGREDETHRRYLLGRFSELSVRYLTDVSVAREVRRQLVDELGRFRDFQPIVLDIEQSFDLPTQSPSLQTLEVRAASVHALVSAALAKGALDGAKRLQTFQREYTALREILRGNANRIGELEREIMSEMGKIVLQ